jgi:hypothetical protein
LDERRVMSKHFNLGNVWGRVAKVTREKSSEGTPYLSIQVECANTIYGNVRTYGRLWKNIDAFFDYYKKNPGSAYRFRGFFSQYDKSEGQRYSNYTFYSWEVFTGEEFRASFILIGEIDSVEEEKLSLVLSREGSEEEEHFEVYSLNRQDLSGISEGDCVKLKGLLRYKEAEDFFGDTSAHGTVKPYIMEIEQVKTNG